jgi:hypothetical protein
MRRREFIKVVAGSAAAATLPLAVRAQQSELVRRVGVLLNLAANDQEEKVRLPAFTEALKQLGWDEGRNLRSVGDREADQGCGGKPLGPSRRHGHPDCPPPRPASQRTRGPAMG